MDPTNHHPLPFQRFKPNTSHSPPYKAFLFEGKQQLVFFFSKGFDLILTYYGVFFPMSFGKMVLFSLIRAISPLTQG